MWVLTPMLAFPYFMGVTANTEIFMLVPLLMFIYSFLLGLEKNKARYWILGGVFSAMALLYKPICLYLIIFVYAVWLVNIWREKRVFLDLFKFILVTLTCGILTV